MALNKANQINHQRVLIHHSFSFLPHSFAYLQAISKLGKINNKTEGVDQGYKCVFMIQTHMCNVKSVDQKSYFALQYMVDGSVVTYATLKNGTFEFEDNSVLYLGHTNVRPRDSVQRYRTFKMRLAFYFTSTYMAIFV